MADFNRPVALNMPCLQQAKGGGRNKWAALVSCLTLEPGRETSKAPMCWVMPPASVAATAVCLKASNRDVCTRTGIVRDRAGTCSAFRSIHVTQSLPGKGIQHKSYIQTEGQEIYLAVVNVAHHSHNRRSGLRILLMLCTTERRLRQSKIFG